MRILAKGKKDIVIKSFIGMAVVAAVIGIVSGYVEKTVLTSAGVGDNSCTTVNGRELPIYAVETDRKVVAISFDAAWADYYL